MAGKERSLGELFGRLLDDGKAYGQAELELARLKLEKKALSYRTAVILGLAAFGLMLSATIALILTLVLWLASLIGPLGGGLVAVAITLAAAAVLALLARKSFEAADE
jgi:hypothetical protein